MYLIPRNVKARFEFFPGFGWFELVSVVGGAILGLPLYFLAGLFTESFFRAVFFIIPPGLLRHQAGAGRPELGRLNQTLARVEEQPETILLRHQGRVIL